MDPDKLFRLNSFINRAYQCFSFLDFLKLSVLELHHYVMYDSGMFFCGISRDSSFFKPYISGPVENYYRKHAFAGRKKYLESAIAAGAAQEACVYKAEEYSRGLIRVAEEPRRSFLAEQKDFHVVCVRTVYQGQV